MPAPIKVELTPHDLRWSGAALDEGERVKSALGDNLVIVHHVGSTAIPGIRAKPVIDLMPVVESLDRLDAARDRIEALGYAWWGEYGLPGRRYCHLDDQRTGWRLVQLHCYQQGNTEIIRHIAFRDYLRSRPEIAARYEAEKIRCGALHPNDSHAYSDCKSDWIRRVEAMAMTELGRKRGS